MLLSCVRAPPAQIQACSDASICEAFGAPWDAGGMTKLSAQNMPRTLSCVYKLLIGWCTMLIVDRAIAYAGVQLQRVLCAVPARVHAVLQPRGASAVPARAGAARRGGRPGRRWPREQQPCPSPAKRVITCFPRQPCVTWLRTYT